jgi:hypothetical protein
MISDSVCSVLPPVYNNAVSIQLLAMHKIALEICTILLPGKDLDGWKTKTKLSTFFNFVN